MDWYCRGIFVTDGRTPSIINIGRIENYVQWIPSTHYSGVNGLLKLAIGELLPECVERAVLIDTDMVFLEEVTKLKLIFDAMSFSNTSIGSVSEYAYWYKNADEGLEWVTPIGASQQARHPVFSETGINSGLVLIDFARLKKEQFQYNYTDKNNKPYCSAYTRVAMGVAEMYLKRNQRTKTGDQDVINAMMIEHPHLFYSMDLEWNYQHCCFTPKDNRCPGPMSVAKILHWNAPAKVLESEANFSKDDNITTEKDKAILIYSLYEQLVGYVQISKEDAKFDFTSGFKYQQQGKAKKFERLLLHALLQSTEGLIITQLAAFKAYQIRGKLLCYNQGESLGSRNFSLDSRYQLQTFNLNMSAINSRNQALVATTLINLPNSIVIGCAFASAANQ